MVEMAHLPTTGDADPTTHVSRDQVYAPWPCPLCDGDDWAYLFVSVSGPIHRCTTCGLTRLHPRPTRSDDVTPSAKGPRDDPFTSDIHAAGPSYEEEAAVAYSQMLGKDGASRSSILLIAPRGHPFAGILGRQSRAPETTLDVRELNRSPLVAARYDYAVVLFELEKAMNPIAVLEQIHAALKPDGLLLLVTRSLDSWPARVFRNEWPGWRQENLYYFDSQTIQSALLRSGFARIRVRRDQRRYSLQHVYERTRAIPSIWLARVVRAIYPMVPRPLRRSGRLRLPTSAIVITARRVERRKQPLLSIIMPVYNERPTFEQTMNAVLAKEVSGVDKEIIVVESNSTDGTRQSAIEYQDCPGVKLVLEDRPRGKGSAVRAGLEHATGDFILIQDGDQEYDVNDYDSLIEPLRTYQRAFVLGSRHLAVDWKVRKFTDQPAIATLFNLGHLLFATALNVMYGQRIRDPFTMYKVFRRDCLHGLKFECNRFDFDFELVIKLVRKGYVPLEIPVNYWSRSLKQGKKVSVIKDPITWLWALIRFRFSRLCS